MKTIRIADRTLCRQEGALGFKEKLEIARQLERLSVDAIELPEIGNVRTDTLLVRTVASFVKNSTISVAAGSTADSIDLAATALANVALPAIRIELPVSPVGMEYALHKKPAKMLDWISACVKKAAAYGFPVEFCAVDATRAEPDFLSAALKAAQQAGATSLTVCDSAADQLPDAFAAFVERLAAELDLPIGVLCEDRYGLATAAAVLAAQKGAAVIKTAVGGSAVPLETLAMLLHDCGNTHGLSARLGYTELHRIIQQIDWICSAGQEKKPVAVKSADDSVRLDSKDDAEAVAGAVMKLGYDLSAEDHQRVYEEFCRVAEKKTVGAKELDAIVASVALQVPATVTLDKYVITSGNVMSSGAQIVLMKDGTALNGIGSGDGPIDAAFRTVEQILGRHYKLEDFQIQSVTEGQEAMGCAIVKLRNGGKIYSGNGISTDIIGASIRAYLGAVNKILYEEA